MSLNSDSDTEALRSWARGLLPLEAAVELLISALSGRLLNGPWVRREGDGRPWFDPDSAAAESGYLSGGERRVLAIATSLAGGDPVDLGDAITGIDHDALRHILAALARASGATIETSASPAGDAEDPFISTVIIRGIDATPQGHAEDTDETFCSHAEYMVATSTIEDHSENSARLAKDTIETPAIHDGDPEVSGTASASALPSMSPIIGRRRRCHGGAQV